MPSLIDHIDTQAAAVLCGEYSLDEALQAVSDWLDDYYDQLTSLDRQTFSATLDRASTGQTESLIDSILRLHTTRLLYRHDKTAAVTAPEVGLNVYEQARAAFATALQESEDAINEARIDVAVANAHNLLGDTAANRRWLDAALDRLPAIAAFDLVALAQQIPAMPLPKLNWWRRIGLQIVGFNFERLAQKNRDSLATIARMQTDQIIIMAHLLGTSYEAIHERQRANRALRVAAHLVMRYDGMHLDDVEQLLDIAEALKYAEPEATAVLAEQARHYATVVEDAEGEERAINLLSD